MEPAFFIILVVILGLFFDYTNGFHDSANVVSTVIASGALRPTIAILLAAILNTLGATQTSKVAQTISTGLIDSEVASQTLIFSALIGAIVWNILTARWGIPSSSSYALIGGLIGVVLVTKGAQFVLWKGVLFKVILPMFLSPFIGFFIAFFFMKILYFSIQKTKWKSPLFLHLQIVSASVVALAHGFNDAQKSMAIITMGLFAAGAISSTQIPFWVILACAITMGLGTTLGGYRIIHTVGYKITKIRPLQGFAAETSASIVLLSAAFLGMPISSTHMIVGSITGVGTARRLQAVEWLIAHKLAIAWIVTMPAAGVIASAAYFFGKMLMTLF